MSENVTCLDLVRAVKVVRQVLGGTVLRQEDDPVTGVSTDAAAALAGLDDLPDTIMTRSIVVRMRRRAPHEVVQPYRRRAHEAEGHALRERVAAWVTRAWDRIDDAWPDLPDGIEDRDADVWEPLIAVADAAGGHWPETARCSAVSLVSAARDNGGSIGVRLLADVRAAFASTGAEKLSTETLLEALCEMDESPWGDIRGKALDSRGLSRRLGRYDVRPKQIRIGDRTCKGYDRADLHETWTRYLPASVSLSEDNGAKADPTQPGGRGSARNTAPPVPGGRGNKRNTETRAALQCLRLPPARGAARCRARQLRGRRMTTPRCPECRIEVAS